MDLKYKPLYLSELEIEYPQIKKFLNENKTFIVNGSKMCGKSTIVKLYLDVLDYDYLLIDDFNLSKDYILDKLKFKTKSVFSYFYKKKFIILIDNFDLFDTNIKDYIISESNNINFLIITNKYLNSKINYVKIGNYSLDYLNELYNNIFFIEKGYNSKFIPKFNNISQLFSLIEFYILKDKDENNNSDENQTNNQYNDNKESNIMFYDDYNYYVTDLVDKSKSFKDKIIILDKISSYNIFQNNIIYNHDNIDNLADSYEILSDSLIFLTNNINNNLSEYYSILSIIGTSYKLNNFKIYKENFQLRKKKYIKYNND